MKKPFFSIIIPARNEEETIEKSIRSILEQSFNDFEIIVSNDGSTDKTESIVNNLIKKDKRIKIINRAKGTSAAFARNKGAAIAKGKILVFLDADTVVNDVFLEKVYDKRNLAEAFMTLNLPVRVNFITKALSGLIGPSIKLPLKDGTIYDEKNKDIPGKMFFCIKKEAYDKIGGYNENIFYYEDEEFADNFYKLGFKSVLVKEAKQYFELPTSFSEFLRQCNWIGRGINSINDKRDKRKKKLIWIGRTIVLLSPLLFLFDPFLALEVFMFIMLLIFLKLIIRNRSFINSLRTLPFFYLKNFLISFSILRFWK